MGAPHKNPLRAEAGAPPRLLAQRRISNILQCSRCGSQELERRSGWFRDADYHELLQDYFAMERRARQAEARLLNERSETAWWREQSLWALDHACILSGMLLRG